MRLGDRAHRLEVGVDLVRLQVGAAGDAEVVVVADRIDERTVGNRIGQERRVGDEARAADAVRLEPGKRSRLADPDPVERSEHDAQRARESLVDREERLIEREDALAEAVLGDPGQDQEPVGAQEVGSGHGALGLEEHDVGALQAIHEMAVPRPGHVQQEAAIFVRRRGRLEEGSDPCPVALGDRPVEGVMRDERNHVEIEARAFGHRAVHRADQLPARRPTAPVRSLAREVDDADARRLFAHVGHRAPRRTNR
ncbi:MAG: hypothetical protein AAGC67_10605 [Myxococcota bacterium]